jgi:hypothetical protein
MNQFNRDQFSGRALQAKFWFAKLLYGFVLSVSLGGCATTGRHASVDRNDPVSVSKAVSTKADEFKKTQIFEAPRGNGFAPMSMFLRASKSNKTGVIAYEIYLTSSEALPPGESKGFTSAYDQDGLKLDLESVVKTESTCSKSLCIVNEELSILVDRNYLEKHQAKGVRFRLYSKVRNDDFTLSPGYIKGFLMAVSQ